MSDVILFGAPASTYVRTCRLALEEKGVAYAMEEAMPNSEPQLERHPFGKIPAFRHGALSLFESLAICRYVDEAFDGPPLQPADPAGRAVMSQWISVYLDYLYRALVVEIVIQRVVVPMRGGTVDEARVAAGAEVADGYCAILDRRLAECPYLAGDDATLADLFLAPAIGYLAALPEGALVARRGNLAAWLDHDMGQLEARIAWLEEYRGNF